MITFNVPNKNHIFSTIVKKMANNPDSVSNQTLNKIIFFLTIIKKMVNNPDPDALQK
jgi:hypothetical protein